MTNEQKLMILKKLRNAERELRIVEGVLKPCAPLTRTTNALEKLLDFVALAPSVPHETSHFGDKP